MEKEIEHIMNKTKQESLSLRERELLRSAVTSFVKEHPIPARVFAKPTPSPFSFEFFVRRHSVFAAAVLVFFLSGTTSVFADKSLPGDVLYPVKTSVNEKVLGWFATSQESRAEWQLSLADRRLQEMQELSKSEKITSDVRDALEEKIESYTELALGASTDSLLGDPDDAVSSNGADVSVSASRGASLMSVSAEIAPVSAKMSAVATSPSEIDRDELKSRIAERRQSVSRQKGELKSEHLYVKRKAAVVVAEKLSLQADSARSRGELDEALRLDKKAEEIISRIQPLSSEVSGSVRGSQDLTQPTSGNLETKSSSGEIEIEREHEVEVEHED